MTSPQRGFQRFDNTLLIDEEARNTPKISNASTGGALVHSFRLLAGALAVALTFAGAAAANAPAESFGPQPRPTDIELPTGFVSDRPIPRPETLAARAAAILERERRARLAAQNRSSRANPRINQNATEDNALIMEGMALIGVFGTEESRRALLRLSNGSFVRVSRGTTIDGWRVIAIGPDELRLLRAGETRRLLLP